MTWLASAWNDFWHAVWMVRFAGILIAAGIVGTVGVGLLMNALFPRGK